MTYNLFVGTLNLTQLQLLTCHHALFIVFIVTGQPGLIYSWYLLLCDWSSDWL